MLTAAARNVRAAGNVLRLWLAPEAFIRRHTGGPVIQRVDFPGCPYYIVADPELLEQIFILQSKNFIKDAVIQGLAESFGKGLVFSEGELWRRQRRLIQPAFHRQRIAAYGAMMVAVAERLADRWRDGEVVDLRAAMSRLSLEIVTNTLFSSDLDARGADEIFAWLEAITQRYSDPLFELFPRLERAPLARNRRYYAARARFDAVVGGILAARRREGREGDGDLMAMLLRASDDEGRMSDEQVLAEIRIMLIAGHETVALALSWAWMLLSQHPAAWARMCAEIDEVLGGRAPTLEDVPKLRYVEWVVLETLRLYPSIWNMGREAVVDIELGGLQIPRGAQLWIIVWALHRDPRYFPRPESFEPERWDGGFQRSLPRCAYFPFGAGPRVCIGNNYAMLEAVLALATLARRFQPRIRPEDCPRPRFTITLRPASPMRAVLRRRGARPE